uniref:Uncharacterized protein n=1 Tax=Litorilinea aerophila TaxID=1204385 RepID=A0A540VLS9_9CHLR
MDRRCSPPARQTQRSNAHQRLSPHRFQSSAVQKSAARTARPNAPPWPRPPRRRCRLPEPGAE